MVTKQCPLCIGVPVSLILAKNHMVTKLISELNIKNSRLILAKNHMVTKHNPKASRSYRSLILAKNHMVTKLTY